MRYEFGHSEEEDEEEESEEEENEEIEEEGIELLESESEVDFR